MTRPRANRHRRQHGRVRLVTSGLQAGGTLAVLASVVAVLTAPRRTRDYLRLARLHAAARSAQDYADRTRRHTSKHADRYPNLTWRWPTTSIVLAEAEAIVLRAEADQLAESLAA